MDIRYCSSIYKNLQSLRRPASAYATGGKTSLPLPCLSVKGMTDPVLSLPLTISQAKDIISVASQAPFGRGKETIVDTSVRCTWQLDPEQFTIKSLDWTKKLHELVTRVQEDLSCGSNVSCELYKFLLYEAGGFFKSHRDTEKSPGMFGTLVIQLPCNYTGGSIVVHHQDEKKEFNFGGSDALGNFYYVAFYADCLHEVKLVTDGYRLCLIYNLIWKGSPNDAPTPPDLQLVINKINLILKEWEKDTESPDSPEMMASLLEHQYSSSSLSFDFLKGIDKSVAAALIVAKSGLHFDLFFVQVNVSQTWSTNQACVGCEHCCYGNNTYEDDDSDIYQEIDIIDEEVSLTYLISSDGWKIKLNGFSIGEKRFFPVLDVSSLEPDDLQGCTGNQGCSVDKLYHLAAFILLPSRNHKCLFGSIVPRVLMELHKSRTLSQDFKGKLRQLQHSGLSQVVHKKTVVLLFQALHSIGKIELMTELLNDTLLHERNGGRVNFFGSKIGWSPLNLPLQTQLRNYSSSDNIQFLYCIIGTAPADDKKTVCCALLYSTLTQLLDEADSKPLQSKDTVCKLFKCLDTLEVTDRLPQLVTKLSTCSTRYPLLDTLVPAIIDLYNTLTHPVMQQCIKELTAHCISTLTESLSEPASPPCVFYSMPISCSCTDCLILSSFLINPNKDEHRFSLPSEKRKHIQDQLKDCPTIKCITESTGRPYTLIVTKTSDSIRNLHQRAFNALTALQSSDDAPPPQKKLKITA